jgi:hypothetical protein
VHHDLYERTNSMISTNYVKLDCMFSSERTRKELTDY